MNYKIKPIQTNYNGTIYRSRLEATWAAFFDLIGIKFQYEPFDCDGWIPDFILYGENNNILVEVKPFYKWEQFGKAKSKAFLASNADELLFIGSGIIQKSEVHHSFLFSNNDYGACIGWLCSKNESNADLAVLVIGENNNADIIGEFGSWHQRLSGFYDGDSGFEAIPYFYVLKKYKEAENITRWRKAG